MGENTRDEAAVSGDLTGSAYKALVESVGKLIEESDKKGRAADSNKAKVNWEIGDKLVAAGLIGRKGPGDSVTLRLPVPFPGCRIVAPEVLLFAKRSLPRLRLRFAE